MTLIDLDELERHLATVDLWTLLEAGIPTMDLIAELRAAREALEEMSEAWAESDTALRREIDKMRATVYSSPEYVLALEKQLSIARRVIDAAELLEGTGPRPILLAALGEWEDLGA
ncbi:MAG: hypothetical protein OK436_07235 [Thaumarchaeota archaeon]|nr:hypothetical protein [Nitrososphaerota archaeon]